MSYELLNLYDKKKCLCHHFLYIFSRRRIDIFRFVSNEIGFDISCKLHEILKPIFQEKYFTMSPADNLPNILIV